tara:strand:- start:16258 stop:16674 length:417 start_codon:yes stop_codon:yes gene_type:complete
MKKFDSIIGIDPGVNTGIAIWNVKNKKFEGVYSCSILEAMRNIEVYAIFGNNQFVIENPNLRKWYGKNSNAKLQGAGSIKRDFSIWVEWFKYHEVNYRELNPKNIRTKLDAIQFKKITGWEAKTNEHSRDAGIMVYGI